MKIHKIKWQKFKFQGFCLKDINRGFVALCNNDPVYIDHAWNDVDGSILWKNVTCKNCLKGRNK